MSKPIIRHCRNCEYKDSYFRYGQIFCTVKYKRIPSGMLRLKALLCKHYKQKSGAE